MSALLATDSTSALDANQSEPVIQKLKKSVHAGGGTFMSARPIPPVLEDVFIYLSEQENA